VLTVWVGSGWLSTPCRRYTRAATRKDNTMHAIDVRGLPANRPWSLYAGRSHRLARIVSIC